jgi:acyl carrier protein
MWTVDLKWNNMTNTPITKEEITEVFPKVAGIVADALPCEIERVTPQASLIDDLGAQSIDFLDLVFRLERAFKVKIPRGKIIEQARGALTQEEFEQRGVVTDAGLERLRTFLSEVPAERFVAPLKVADVPRLFTAETFCKVVIRQQRAVVAAQAGVTAS